jgi:GT2 family glycosyltransferase
MRESLRRRLSVVVLSYNRADELARTLAHLRALPEAPAIVVVDNASTDGSAARVARDFPDITLIALDRNIGAAARNIGVRHVHTPFVAFADDDSWWEPGSLARAVHVLDAHRQLAAVCARVLLGAEAKEDPVCRIMADSPLPSDGLPGPALLGFIACAVVFRRDAYLAAGGYEEKFFVGGEEELLTLDLAAAGWRVVYLPQLTVHHHPSPRRDNRGRQTIVIRNALWVAWLRLPLSAALGQSRRIWRGASSRAARRAGLMQALRELPWVVRNRKVLPSTVQTWYLRLHA